MADVVLELAVFILVVTVGFVAWLGKEVVAVSKRVTTLEERVGSNLELMDERIKHHAERSDLALGHIQADLAELKNLVKGLN